VPIRLLEVPMGDLASLVICLGDKSLDLRGKSELLRLVARFADRVLLREARVALMARANLLLHR